MKELSHGLLTPHGSQETVSLFYDSFTLISAFDLLLLTIDVDCRLWTVQVRDVCRNILFKNSSKFGESSCISSEQMHPPMESCNDRIVI